MYATKGLFQVYNVCRMLEDASDSTCRKDVDEQDRDSVLGRRERLE
jgi:hypothetical protein